LLAAAVELIPERGWTAVSTRTLAERAGVTPSVVHYHFPSLQALLNEAVISTMRQVLGEMDPLLDAVPGPAELVDALMASVAQYTGADPLSLLFVEAYLAATRDERLAGQLRAVLVEIRERLARLLAAHGVVAPDATAAVLGAAVDGLLLHRALAGTTEGVTAVLRRIVERTEEQG
jgi:AcrR family transcriptional regulator